jgi:membrane fusion protein (multidrug efflux system)
MSAFETARQHVHAAFDFINATLSRLGQLSSARRRPAHQRIKQATETNQRVNNLMKARPILALIPALISLSLPACARMQAEEQEESHHEQNKIIVTSPQAKDVIITQPYVCQIHSRRHIEIRALEEGYLEAITVKEGQAVKQGDVMFEVKPVLYKARLEAEKAEAQFARVELANTRRLFDQNVVSAQEVALYEAKLAKAVAKVELAKAELNFTYVKAPFDGIMDRLRQQQGSLVKKEEILTTLSDNSVMWVYFNVPEARYFEFKNRQGQSTNNSRLELVDSRIELRLAGGSIFPHSPIPNGNVVTVEGKFNNQTGNIAFRADFPNPEGLLRHGQTGTVLIHHREHNAIVIPQRATFEILDQRYVWVVDQDNVAHQRPITLQHELEDTFVIQSGIGVKDKIVLEGVQQVHDGQKLEEVEFEKPEEALAHQKFHAE